jgi:hypothetical protein
MEIVCVRERDEDETEKEAAVYGFRHSLSPTDAPLRVCLCPIISLSLAPCMRQYLQKEAFGLAQSLRLVLVFANEGNLSRPPQHGHVSNRT